METEQVNRVSTWGLIALSTAAFATVLIGLVMPAALSGHMPVPEPDEGTAAHIFQLSLVALVPVGFVFLATADWTRPLKNVRRLAFPAAAVIMALSILYYFEKYHPPHH